jgi:hypothetical protein
MKLLPSPPPSAVPDAFPCSPTKARHKWHTLEYKTMLCRIKRSAPAKRGVKINNLNYWKILKGRTLEFCSGKVFKLGCLQR